MLQTALRPARKSATASAAGSWRKDPLQAPLEGGCARAPYSRRARFEGARRVLISRIVFLPLTGLQEYRVLPITGALIWNAVLYKPPVNHVTGRRASFLLAAKTQHQGRLKTAADYFLRIKPRQIGMTINSNRLCFGRLNAA